jgi:hypothetical protein
MPETLHDTMRVVESTLAQLREPDLWWQVGIVALVGGGAWVAARALSKFFKSREAEIGAAAQVAVSLARRTLLLLLLGLGAIASGSRAPSRCWRSRWPRSAC